MCVTVPLKKVYTQGFGFFPPTVLFVDIYFSQICLFFLTRQIQATNKFLNFFQSASESRICESLACGSSFLLDIPYTVLHISWFITPPPQFFFWSAMPLANHRHKTHTFVIGLCVRMQSHYTQILNSKVVLRTPGCSVNQNGWKNLFYWNS